MAEEYSTAGSLEQPTGTPLAPASSGASGFRMVFLGPNGLRAGWRLLIFVVVFFLLGKGLNFTIRHIPPLRDYLKAQNPAEFTPAGLIVREGLGVVLLVAACCVMTLIERRPFGAYGMPMKEALGKRFWQGVPLGFVMLSLLLAMMAALHGFSLDGVAVGGAAAWKYGAIYFFGFILVGIAEELSFRGYFQFTLGSGIGFWPAAILLSIAFGAIHLNNPGEKILGGIMAGSFGLVAAFALYRTGNLWVPIGMHASWDWGETYFYGTPDSGLLAKGHFLNSSPHGPNWLSGGSVGPEGSYLVFAILIIWAIAIHFLFPARTESTA
ncbi:MAG: lysostaphin resistance A-like protein [Candidatus Acidiferrales bacterium]